MSRFNYPVKFKTMNVEEKDCCNECEKGKVCKADLIKQKEINKIVKK